MPSLFLLLLSSVVSNGCMVDAISEAKLGAFRPLKAERIQIVSETLAVVLRGDSAWVHARYTLRNDGDTVRGTYGAPIDFDPSEGESDSVWDSRIYSSATIALDGQPPQTLLAGSVQKGPNSTADRVQYRRWFTAGLIIGPGRHRLDLQVVSMAAMSDATSKYVNLVEHSDRVLQWDLAPAAKWGAGIAADFLLTVDASALERDSIPWSLSGLKPTREGGVWVYRGHNLALATAKTLRFQWLPDAVLREKSFASRAWKHPVWRGSSDLAAYPLAALTDGSLATAWVGPRAGQGAWLETDVPKNVRLTDVVVCGGYAKSPDLWRQNDRVARLALRLYQGTGDSCLAHCWGEDASSGSGRPLPMPHRVGECEIYQIQSQEGDELKSGGRLRLWFPETIPGTRSRDLPISEILLLQ